MDPTSLHEWLHGLPEACLGLDCRCGSIAHGPHAETAGHARRRPSQADLAWGVWDVKPGDLRSMDNYDAGDRLANAEDPERTHRSIVDR